jgi:hypothetical protein
LGFGVGVGVGESAAEQVSEEVFAESTIFEVRRKVGKIHVSIVGDDDLDQPGQAADECCRERLREGVLFRPGPLGFARSDCPVSAP